MEYCFSTQIMNILYDIKNAFNIIEKYKKYDKSNNITNRRAKTLI